MKLPLKWRHSVRSGALLMALCLWLAYCSVTRAQIGAKVEKSDQEKAIVIGGTKEIRTARYSVIGDREGRVKFGDFQRKIFNHFQMDAGKWARELFVLDDGKTVGAAQEDHTVFWNTTTGKEIGRVSEHVYGFSHDQKHFIAQNDQTRISLYTYPNLKRVAQIQSPPGGVSAYLFSPNDRYCAVEFQTAYPASENTYPNVYSRKNLSSVRLYKLDPFGEVPNFAELHTLRIGSFAADSSAYMGDGTIYNGSDWITGSWRFNLKTSSLEAVASLLANPKK